MANILQNIGNVLQSAASPQFVEQQRQRQALAQVGQILGGQVPPLAPNVQGPRLSPEQRQITPQQQLAALGQLGTPEAIAAQQNILARQPTAFQQRQLGLQEGRLGLEQQRLAETVRQFEEKQRLTRQQEERRNRALNLQESLFTSGQDFGRVTQDLVEPSGVKDQISQLKQQNKSLMGGLLDPNLKDFTKAQIAANNEEIDNLRSIEKEKRDLEKGLAPEAAAKAAMVSQGIKNLDEALKILTDPKTGEDISFLEAASAGRVGVQVPFGPFLGVSGVPGTKGRRVRSLLLNAVNAQLRAESGAAVPESEVERAAQRFLPSPLDDAETRKAKLENLRGQLKSTFDILKKPESLTLDEEPSVINYEDLP